MTGERELSVPVFARLASLEVQLGVLTLATGRDPVVQITPQQLQQAGRVLTPAVTGEHTAPPGGRETIYVRTEVGVIQAMDLPLHESIQDRLRKGYLSRVNPDGSEYRPPPGQSPTRPDADGVKADWVGWVVRTHGVDPDQAEAMTKQDLIELDIRLGADQDQPRPPTEPAPPPAPAAGGLVQRPPVAANKAAWVDWATEAHGLPQDKADAMTVKQLQELPDCGDPS